MPTTVIFTRTDEIVIPQFGPETSSRLPGSSQFPLQDLDVCGPLHVADHLSMLIDPAAYAIAVQAFTKKGAASLKEFDRTSCFNFRNTALGFDDVLPALRFSANLGLAVLDSGGSYAQEEPPLKQCRYTFFSENSPAGCSLCCVADWCTFYAFVFRRLRRRCRHQLRRRQVMSPLTPNPRQVLYGRSYARDTPLGTLTNVSGINPGAAASSIL